MKFYLILVSIIHIIIFNKYLKKLKSIIVYIYFLSKKKKKKKENCLKTI